MLATASSSSPTGSTAERASRSLCCLTGTKVSKCLKGQTGWETPQGEEGTKQGAAEGAPRSGGGAPGAGAAAHHGPWRAMAKAGRV